MEKAPEAFRIISEVATDLSVPQHVLRFWESRFVQIRPMKRGGGRRYYRPDDVDLLRGIRHLLYSEGYTIRGAQRILREQGVQFVQAVWNEGAPQPPRSFGGDEAAEAAATGGLGLRELLAAFRGARTARGEVANIDIAIDDPEGEAADMADDDEATSAEDAADIVAPGPAAAAMRGLARDEIVHLESALDELGECRRLLDAVVDQASR